MAFALCILDGLPGVRPEYNAAQIPPSPLQSWHDTTGSSEGVWDTNWERQGDEDLFSDGKKTNSFQSGIARFSFGYV